MEQTYGTLLQINEMKCPKNETSYEIKNIKIYIYISIKFNKKKWDFIKLFIYFKKIIIIICGYV